MSAPTLSVRARLSAAAQSAVTSLLSRRRSARQPSAHRCEPLEARVMLYGHWLVSTDGYCDPYPSAPYYCNCGCGCDDSEMGGNNANSADGGGGADGGGDFPVDSSGADFGDGGGDFGGGGGDFGGYGSGLGDGGVATPDIMFAGGHGPTSGIYHLSGGLGGGPGGLRSLGPGTYAVGKFGGVVSAGPPPSDGATGDDGYSGNPVRYFDGLPKINCLTSRNLWMKVA